MTTEERLEKLERELADTKRRNRWLLAVMALTLVGVAYALDGTFQRTANTVSNQGTGGAIAVKDVAATQRWQDTPVIGKAQKAANTVKPAQAIRATAFVLVDDKGRERGKFEMLGKGPRLVLSDQNGRTRAMLDVDKDGLGMLSLCDENGKGGVSLQTLPDGPGVVLLCDENDEVRVGLHAGKDGPELALNGANGKHRAKLYVGEGGSGLELSDGNGVRRVSLSAIEDQAGLFLAENGKPRVMLGADKNGARLWLIDPNGSVKTDADKDGPELCLSDGNGKDRVTMNGYKDGPLLSLNGENGREGVILSDFINGPELSLVDKNGKLRAALTVVKNGPWLDLRDENDKTLWKAP